MDFDSLMHPARCVPVSKYRSTTNMATQLQTERHEGFDVGYEHEERTDILGWDLTLYVGWFHVIISHTSGRVS